MLATAVQSVTVQLGDILHPQALDKAATLHFLRCLTNVTRWKTEIRGNGIPNYHLDQHIAASGLECWPRYLTQDGTYIKMLALTEPPAQTFPHLLRGLLSVPCNMTVCSEWKREPNHTVRREIDRKRRHYHLAKSFDALLSRQRQSAPRRSADRRLEDCGCRRAERRAARDGSE
jgi:hypothetical protein